MVVVIIPALNPGQYLLDVLAELRAQSDVPVVVVNDGSEAVYDAVFAEVEALPDCFVTSHEQNMGKGAALKTGLRFMLESFPASMAAITADGDGQHAVSDILALAALVEQPDGALILGARDFSATDVPGKSRWGNRITSVVFRATTGLQVSDTQTGLRVIPRDFAERCLDIAGDRYEFEMNMLLAAHQQKRKIFEVPITTIYLDGNQASHFIPLWDSMRIYGELLKFACSSLLSSCCDLIFFTIFFWLLFDFQLFAIVCATIFARLLSGGINFWINKAWVFGQALPGKHVLLKYMLLFFTQMMLSWIIVQALSFLPVYIVGIKVLVDVVLFFISYRIQRNYIFNMQV